MPRYLKAALESARFFNPEARLVLITDKRADLSWMRCEVRDADEFRHPLIAEFDRVYIKIHGSNAYRARVFMTRWFHVESFLRKERIGECLYFDSDALLFHDGAEVFSHAPAGRAMVFGRNGSPAITMIRETVEPFLKLMIAGFADPELIQTWRKKYEASVKIGGMANLSDMKFLVMLADAQPSVAGYFANDLPIGHIDNAIFGADGYQARPVRRHPDRKRIFWEDDGTAFLPTLRRQSDGARVPALLIHFQNGAKRRIRRFNRVGADSPLPRSWRLAYYNRILG